MFHSITIRPRFSETDAAGHINNTSVMPWLEDGRVSIRRAAETELLTVLARIEADYEHEILFGSNVVVKTGIDRIGRKSVVYVQEIWQANKRCLHAISVGVGFDPRTHESIVISDTDRRKLSPFLVAR
jgi:acyl-CoA thioester hydrolase